MTQSNPFEMFKDLDLEKMFDVESMFKDMKLPGVDMDSLMASQKRNIEAITEANKVAFQGAQALATRQGEIMREAMQELSHATQELMTSASPQEASSKQAELVKEGLEKALANMRELAEMSAKSSSEAFGVVNGRLNESMEEFKKLMAQVKSS